MNHTITISSWNVSFSQQNIFYVFLIDESMATNDVNDGLWYTKVLSQ